MVLVWTSDYLPAFRFVEYGKFSTVPSSSQGSVKNNSSTAGESIRIAGIFDAGALRAEKPYVKYRGRPVFLFVSSVQITVAAASSERESIIAG
jgi:hypothetical protein